MKKVLAYVLALSMVLGILPAAAFASALDSPAEISTAEEFAAASPAGSCRRTADGVYQISSGGDLAWRAQQVNGGDSGLDAVLTRDIDLGGEVTAPDGRIFAVNGKCSDVSASLAAVRDGDRIIWSEGTAENRFLPPAWAYLEDSRLTWTEIASADELTALARSTDGETLAGNYRLTADLDLTGVDFPGIGSSAHPFTGIFDGQGHQISNAVISGNENVGFFNVIKGAAVKNLSLVNVTVTGQKNTGALAGLAQAELDTADTTLNAANLIGSCHVTGTVSGNQQAGGLVGLNGGAYDQDTLFSIASAVDKCTADVAVYGSCKVGGLIGENQGAVTSCASSGAVDASGGSMAGGLAGDNTGDIYDSRSAGTVTAASTAGGFVGYSDGAVKNSYSLGDVYGADVIGGFAGSISRADTVVSAGMVNITGTQTQGYAGGFAGNMGGSIAGLSSQVTVKNAYGNCAGGAISVVGNASSFAGGGQQEVLRQMTLDSPGQVNAKLFELFGVQVSAAGGEEEKFSDGVRAPANAGAGDTVALLKPGETLGEGVTAVYEVAENDYLSGGAALTLKKANDTFATITVPVTVRLTDSSGSSAQKTSTVILPVSEAARGGIMDAIAGTLTRTSSGWAAMDMQVYGTLEGKTAAVTGEARQNILNLLIGEASGEKASVSDRSRIEIILRSLGIDSGSLYAADSSAPFSNAERLREMDLTSGGYFAAPWILLAEQQGNAVLSDSQRRTLVGMLKDNVGDGMFSYEYGGVSYADPDTAGVALAALARLYGSSGDAKDVADKILEALPGALDAKGSLGNANSDAMMLIGLLAMGRDPGAYAAASGATLADGLLSYANETGSGFLYPNFSTNSLEENALATEQGFRALVAMAKADGRTAYNIYDFSAAEVQPGRAAGTGTIEPPSPEPPSGRGIQVKLTVRTDTETWIDRADVSLDEGSTVCHALVKALDQAGMSAYGADSGYVKSITKGGTTLSEFDKGPNSGWLYHVDGKAPNVPLTQYALEGGEEIVWFYSADYQESPDSSGGLQPAAPDEAAGNTINTIEKTAGPEGGAVITVTAPDGEVLARVSLPAAISPADYQFADVPDGHWAAKAICDLAGLGVIKGISEETRVYDMDSSITRSALANVLCRLSNGTAGAGSPFSDVDAGAWYAGGVAWAARAGVITGYENGAFGPENPISRQELAVMLYRYARLIGVNTDERAQTLRFDDAGAVADWAQEAAAWCAASGILKGTDGGRLNPQGAASRAECAVMLARFISLV